MINKEAPMMLHLSRNKIKFKVKKKINIIGNIGNRANKIDGV